jgi:acyl phosphate:glycerol-3-phosphate acyltransferase
MLTEIVFVIIAYLLGSIPFGYLLVKYLFTKGEDVRRVGSGGTGATNVTRRAGRLAGVLTYIFDVAKGAAAVFFMKQVTDDYFWIGAAAIAVVLGHIFPVFLRFRGGKGVAAGMGAYLLVAPYAVLAAFALFAVIVYFTRYMSLGSIIGAVSLPVWTLIFYGWLTAAPSPHIKAMVVTAIALGALVVAKHHENISRLIHGTESKFGERVSAASPVSEGQS